MRTSSTAHALAGAVIASLALAFGGYAAEPAGHRHDAAGLTALQLDHGKKWGTDAPLRKGMEAIRTAVEADKPAIHSGKMSTARYEALGKKVDAQVAFIVKNCKLSPEADAQLHLVIAQMMEGADAVKGKGGKVSRKAGVEKLAGALDAYGKHFEHPGWPAVD